MHINVRIRHKQVIEHLEMLDTGHDRGARSRFVNDALSAYMGRPPVPENVLTELNTLLRQMVGIATNINQIAHNSNMRQGAYLPTVTDLEAIARRLRDLDAPLRRTIKRWSLR